MGKRRPKQKENSHVKKQSTIQKSTVDVNLLRIQVSNPNPKHVGPFSDRHRILTIGDGDLSFSLALATQLGGQNVIATTYDTSAELEEKYEATFRPNLNGLHATGAQVHYNVDVTKLSKETWLKKTRSFHRIVFNFPHIGGSTEPDIVKNQRLLRQFFAAVSPYLLDHPKSFIIVSLRQTLFYDRWNIEEQASTAGLKLDHSEPFLAHLYSGYTPQRTHPAVREPPSTDGAKMYFFTKSGAKPVPVVEKRIDNKSFGCATCQIEFDTEKKYNTHMKSSKHARRVKRSKK